MADETGSKDGGYGYGKGYGKMPMWVWIVIYVIIGGLVYWGAYAWYRSANPSTSGYGSTNSGSLYGGSSYGTK